MADDTNFRSYRPADQRRPAQTTPTASGRQGGGDPLAELARLIGQTDPFSDLNQGAPRANAPVPSRPAPVAIPSQPPLRRPVVTPSAPSDPYGSPLQFSPQQFDNRGATEPQHEGFQPAYDPAVYGTPEQQQAGGYPSDAYYDDPSRMPQGEEAYEEDYAEERPRHGIMKLAAVVVGLAVIGTGAVLGYRAIFTGGASGPPPVIKANTAPSKIVPTPAAEASNKQIYDRVGDASQGERVVSREEKPIEVKDDSRQAPRAVFPGAGVSANTQDMATASPPLNTDPGGPSSAEPKKIRTVTIRPDGTGSTPAPRPAAAPASERMASAAPVPAAAPSRPIAEPTTASRGNAPLSLSPQVANAEASARPAFPPPPKPAAAAAAPTRVAAMPPAAEVASGGYTVQISSQRSETEAQASFRSLQTKFPSLLSDRQPIIRRADLGEKGIYFRAMVGPFASGEQAVQFCGSLKSAGGQCVVQKN
jgi:SPOR domain